MGLLILIIGFDFWFWRKSNNKLVIEINQFAICLFGDNKHSIKEVLRRIDAVGDFSYKIKTNTPADIKYYGIKGEDIFICSIIVARDILTSKNYLSKKVANYVQHINRYKMLDFFEQLIKADNIERMEIFEYIINNRNHKNNKKEDYKHYLSNIKFIL